MTDQTDTTDQQSADEAVEADDPTTAPAEDAAADSDGEGEDATVAEADADDTPDWEALAEEDGRSPAELLAALTETQAERDDYLDALQRSRAEFDNFRRRSAREAAGARQAGVGDLATQLLDVIDDLDRTVAAAEASSDEGLATGIGAIRRKLVDVLVAAGVERVDTADVPFDANRHEAVQQVPADEPVDEPEVAQVLRPGYVHGERVLRAAMVTVRQ